MNFLKDDYVSIAGGKNVVAYIKSGDKAQSLISGREKVDYFVDTSQRGGMALGEVESLPENEQKLREMEEECLEELKQVVLAAGQDYYPDNKINNVNEVIQIEALRLISRRLPVTREQLLQIDYMTQFRCEQYESVIFGTTRHYHDIRMEHLRSMAAARQEQLQEEARTKVVTSSSAKKGRKSWGRKKGRGKRKTGGSTRGRKTKTTSSRGRGASSSSRATASSSRGGSASSSRGAGSMGLPKFGTNRFGAANAGLYTFM